MKDIDDGGWAFPRQIDESGPGFPGMTLRDWFAGQAMVACMEQYFKFNGACFGQEHWHNNIPAHAYDLADAMIAARKAKP